MAGISPKLPVVPDENDGFKLTKTYREVVVQNFMNVMLTSPGERVMDPEFGVGLRKYLFEPNESNTYSEIEARIHSQTKKYLPFVQILNVEFTDPIQASQSILDGGNYMGVRVTFKIIPLGVVETLSLPICHKQSI